ncbi:MAG: hypothetical protein M3552_00490 [Planctomycetota bacterium]|nr:hypothetical protein [Planctomycetota bacterium]
MSILYTGDLTLFDDESVREKLTVMTKWDAMLDDDRNPDLPSEDDAMFELGGTYRFTIERIEPFVPKGG